VNRKHAFTIVEILVAITIAIILGAISVTAYFKAVDRAKTIKSIANLRSLAAANIAYAGDNGGTFCPAQDSANRTRWHGARKGGGGAFDPAMGFLSPYLGRDARVGICPFFLDAMESGSFELGSGGYGYNSHYVGGSPGKLFDAEQLANITNPSRTVMFTTTALSRSGGIQEYPYTEPFKWVDRNGNLAGPLQPSTHFRANGKALVAWCDGHVTAEPPNEDVSGKNFYGGDNKEAQIGWFGPPEQNGYWNPKAEAKIFRP
jgi:prepilin-type processing-associated H-X9-DG protein